MTSLTYLLGLLLLAYLGSFLVGKQSMRGFGLSSSVEFVVLGFLVGPVLGIFDRTTIGQFDSLTHTAIGWLSLVVGLDYGYVDGTRVRLRGGLAGSVVALITFAIIFGVLWTLLPRLLPLGASDSYVLAAGVAVACTETTRHAIRWMVERYEVEGPMTRLLAEMADVEDLIPILASAAIFALNPLEHAPLSPGGTALLSVGLGVVTGLVTSALLGREFRLDESWRLLLGASLLTIGLSVQARTSPLTTMFLMGVTISVTSRHRHEIVAMTAPTERAVLLPALLVAGARLDLTSAPLVPAVAAIALAARLGAKLLCGLGLRALLPEARQTRPWMGLSLVSTGGLAMSIGLAFDLRFPGPLGNAVLASAAAATLLGEFIGPPALRATLSQVGELPSASTTPRPS